MRLATRIAFVRSTAWPAILGSMTAAAATLLAVSGAPGPVIGGTVGTGAVALATWRQLAGRWIYRIRRRHTARITAALDEGDHATVRRLHDELAEIFDAANDRASAALVRAHALAHEERWPEAMALAEPIDAAQLDAQQQRALENLLIWCLAHHGRTAEAVARARTAVATQATMVGTLGCALVFDRQYADALAPLREALTKPRGRAPQAVHHFYLAEALSALGRHDEAHASWTAAATIAPNSRYGILSKSRLDAGPPTAYR